MRKAYLDLIKYALDDGKDLDIFDGEDWFRDVGYKAAKDAVEAVEEAWIYIRDDEGRLGTAYAIPYGCAPDETIGDWGIVERDGVDYIDVWFNKYNYGDAA